MANATSARGAEGAAHRRRVALHAAFAAANSASFVAMALCARHVVFAHCAALPFQWQMLICMLEGYTLPLTIIGCVALCNILFWKRDAPP